VATRCPTGSPTSKKRLAKIKAAKAALEAEAEAAAEAACGAQEQRPKAPAQSPPDKAQRNFTDPDSRILKTKDGFIQGYNGQAAVDAAQQIIVAHGPTDATSDQDQLAPLVERIESALAAKPKELSADAGYCSEDNLTTLVERGIRGYIATGRQKHGTPADLDPRAGKPEGRHGRAAETRRAAQPIPDAQGDRRAGVRSDQRGPRLPPIPPARPRQGHTRMGPRVHRPQPD
jgi:hypothetical protein